MHSVCSFLQEGSISASAMLGMRVMDMSAQKLVSMCVYIHIAYFIFWRENVSSLDNQSVFMPLL
jgi:hypothetical protein